MNKHTPGTWHEGAGNGTGSIFADDGRMRFESDGTTLYPICEVNHGWDEEEDAANARLIAAAPELLAALLLAVKLADVARNHFPKSMQNADKFTLENCCAAITKAIAKATQADTTDTLTQEQKSRLQASIDAALAQQRS